MFYSYIITQGVPVKDMLNSFKVDDLGAGRSKVTLKATMREFIENPNMSQADFKAFLVSNGMAVINGLANIYNK